MVETKFVPIFAILLILSGCVREISISPSSTPASGIEGHVTEGPMCPGPVSVGNNTCPNQPYPASISILDAHNNQITKFETDSSEYFKIALTPGSYILHPESDKVLPRAVDQSCVVTMGKFTQVSIIYDTGMR